jgi:hypothetical protein
MRSTLLVFAVLCGLLLAISPSAPAQTAYANPILVDAATLATDYKENLQTASAKYRDRLLTITGTVKKIQKDMGGGGVAQIYFETAPGLPPVRVAVRKLTLPSNFQKNWGCHHTSSMHYRTENGVIEESKADLICNGNSRASFTSRKSPWKIRAKVSELVTVTGVCKGFSVEVQVVEATLE